MRYTSVYQHNSPNLTGSLLDVSGYDAKLFEMATNQCAIPYGVLVCSLYTSSFLQRLQAFLKKCWGDVFINIEYVIIVIIVIIVFVDKYIADKEICSGNDGVNIADNFSILIHLLRIP